MEVIRQHVGIMSKDEFQDWVAGQEAIREISKFLFGVRDGISGRVFGYYALLDLSPLVKGQKIVEVGGL
jgi:hypothetical protein